MEPKRKVDDTFAQARVVMVRKDFFGGRKYYEQKGRANRDGADPDILLFERRFIAHMKSIGIPFFGHCVVRTHAEQQERFDAGRSKAPPGQSPHQYGCAVDLIHSTLGWELPGQPGQPLRENKCWQLVGVIGKEVAHAAGVPIVWGGDWGWDYAHWELADWRSRAGPIR